MKNIRDLCIAEKYTDKQGNEKTSWRKIGRLFIKEGGKISLKMEAIPVGWDGWMHAFERKADPNNSPAYQQAKQTRDNLTKDFDDDLPF